MLSLIATYKYLILFPLAVFEGPFLTVVAGLFVRTGVLNAYIVYNIVVLADVTGDTIAYSVGRFAGPIFLNKFSKFFRITPEKREQARVYFDANRKKTLVLSKVVHGVGIAGLMTAGNLKIPYYRFLLTCVCVSLVQSAVFLTVGILFGQAYVQIGHYLDVFGQVSIVVGIVVALVVFLYYRFRKA